MGKKLLALLLCGFLLSALAWGCGKQNKEKETKKEKKVSGAADSAFMKKNAEEYEKIKEVVDMPVYAPEYLPSGIKIQRAIKIKSANSNPAYYEVDYTKGLTISGSSNPEYRTDGEFIGEFALAGRHMSEFSRRDNENSYQLLWRGDGATYIVSIDSSDGMTKDEAKKIAESMKLLP